MSPCTHGERKKEPVVPLADAGANPRTVVIVHLYTGLAVVAVEGPRRPCDVAGTAHADCDLLAFHYCIVLKVGQLELSVR
jgi:hypothetical protein